MITSDESQTCMDLLSNTMACIPSPVQTLEDSVCPLSYDDISLYDPYSSMVVKSEPDQDFGCLSTMSPCSDPLSLASSLPSFGQTFYNTCPYSPERSGCMQSWTSQHPENWSSQDVLDWVYFVAEKNGWDASQIRGERFQNVNGRQLCRMKPEDFISCDDIFGACIYDILQELLTGAKFCEPKCEPNMSSDNFPMLSPQTYMEDKLTDISNSTCTEDSIKVLIGGDVYDIDIKLPIDIPGVDSGVEPIDPGYYSESSTDFDRDSDTHSEHMDYIDMDTFSSSVCQQSCFLPPKHRSHSDSVSSLYSDTSEEPEPVVKPPPKKHTHRGRPAGQASKGNHLWEFIRDTLKDSNFNPTLLKWEDKDEGVFRFVQSEAVAQMWGRKKNNKGMTYEKLSRAMRFCRTTGYFAPLPKNGKYPKKLCFKFGNKAYGWQE